jgi:hypothetical protein
VALAVLLGCWSLAGSQAPSSKDRDRLAVIQVELAWLADPALCCYYPCARVEGDTLQVFGYVPSDQVRAKALEVAQGHTRLHVVDRMKVHPGLVVQPVRVATDQMLRSAALTLKAAFPQDYKRWQIGMRGDGCLIVGGTVDSFEQKLQISQRLRKLPGCTCVDNRMQVVSLAINSPTHAVPGPGAHAVPAAAPAPAAGVNAVSSKAPTLNPASPASQVPAKAQSSLPAVPALPPAVPAPLAKLPDQGAALGGPGGNSPYAPASVTNVPAPTLPAMPNPNPMPALPTVPAALPALHSTNVPMSTGASPYAPSVGGSMPNGSVRPSTNTAIPAPPAPNPNSGISLPALPPPAPMPAPVRTNNDPVQLPNSPMSMGKTPGLVQTNYQSTVGQAPPAQRMTPAPAAGSVQPVPNEGRLIEAIRKACGSSLTRVQLTLNGSTVTVRFATTSEAEAERIADTIMYHIPELSPFTVEMAVEVPR